MDTNRDDGEEVDGVTPYNGEDRRLSEVLCFPLFVGKFGFNAVVD